MKNAIAIAVAKVKKRIKFASGSSDTASLELEVSKAWLSVLLLTGALFATGAVVCLVNGLIKSGGLFAFLRGWLSALGG
jgi:hypothetical protein